MPDKNRMLQRIWVLIILLLALGSGLLVRSITTIHNRQASATSIASSSGSFLETLTKPISDVTPTMKTPLYTPNRTPTAVTTQTYWNVATAQPISETQLSPILKSETGEDEVYLYKDVIISLSVDLSSGMGARAITFLNLDDLDNNGYLNSDMTISGSQGSGTFFELYPANSALDYPANSETTYDYCVDHLYDFGVYPGGQWTGPYCFRTDENRIAIVEYVTDSNREINGIWTMSYRITVFKQKVN